MGRLAVRWSCADDRPPDEADDHWGSPPSDPESGRAFSGLSPIVGGPGPVGTCRPWPRSTPVERAPRLERSRSDRWIAGVAGGIGHHLGVQPNIVRIAFVVLAFAAGFGLVVYVLTWLLAPLEALDRRSRGRRHAASSCRRPRRAVGIGLVIVGMLVLLWLAGLWFQGNLAWPVVLAAIGFAVLWARGDGGRGRWNLGPWGRRSPLTRFAIGAVLILGGMAVFLAASTSVDGARQRAAGDDRGPRRRGAARRPVDLGHGPTARRRAQQPRPIRGACRDGRAPPRLGAPDPRAHPALEGRAGDGEPRPHAGARAARLAVRAGAGAGGRATARRDRLDGRADRATAPGQRRGRRRRRRGDGRAPSRPRQRLRRGRGQRGRPLGQHGDQRLRRGREGRWSPPSFATRAPASIPRSSLPTGAASPTRSSGAWSATAARRPCTADPGAGTEVVLKLPRRAS